MPLYMTFEKMPHMGRCFDIKTPSFPLDGVSHLTKIADHRGNEFIETTVKRAWVEKLPLCVFSNVSYLRNPTLLRKHLPLLSTVLRPSAVTREMVEVIMRRHGLVPKGFFSAHIRCGDLFMKRENNGCEFQTVDKRTDVNMDHVRTYDTMIQRCVTDRSKQIVIHSDSQEFKRLMKEYNPSYIILDTEIQHVANPIGKNTFESYLSTISEFYILMNSCGVIMPNYSGFSHIASFMAQVPLFYKMPVVERWHLEMLESFPTEGMCIIPSS
jgi:hypothetical protein